MHEWLEALRQRAEQPPPAGVPAEALRRAETAMGVELPEAVADLYAVLDGGRFHGGLQLFCLHGGTDSPCVLEKSRLKLVGLPAAGVWRLGLVPPHLHLFAAHTAAMREQGDGGGELPGWFDALEDDAWVYGTWENERAEMELFRTLPELLARVVPGMDVPASPEPGLARRARGKLKGALQKLSAAAAKKPRVGGSVREGTASPVPAVKSGRKSAPRSAAARTSAAPRPRGRTPSSKPRR